MNKFMKVYTQIIKEESGHSGLILISLVEIEYKNLKY